MGKPNNSNRRLWTIVFLFILLALVLYQRYGSHSSDNGHSLIEPQDAEVWNHIYHNNRLKVLQGRITATGIIDAIRIERDGDEHILLRLDKGEEDLLNNMNITRQHGDLVLEPICINKVKQEDAIEPCKGYINNVTIPNIGDTVTATGTYVLDMEHGWNEIHPVISIIVKGRPGN